jgi:hypothetical protein
MTRTVRLQRTINVPAMAAWIPGTTIPAHLTTDTEEDVHHAETA